MLSVGVPGSQRELESFTVIALTHSLPSSPQTVRPSVLSTSFVDTQQEFTVGPAAQAFLQASTLAELPTSLK